MYTVPPKKIVHTNPSQSMPLTKQYAQQNQISHFDHQFHISLPPLPVPIGQCIARCTLGEFTHIYLFPIPCVTLISLGGLRGVASGSIMWLVPNIIDGITMRPWTSGVRFVLTSGHRLVLVRWIWVPRYSPTSGPLLPSTLGPGAVLPGTLVSPALISGPLPCVGLPSPALCSPACIPATLPLDLLAPVIILPATMPPCTLPSPSLPISTLISDTLCTRTLLPSTMHKSIQRCVWTTAMKVLIVILFSLWLLKSTVVSSILVISGMIVLSIWSWPGSVGFWSAFPVSEWNVKPTEWMIELDMDRTVWIIPKTMSKTSLPSWKRYCMLIFNWENATVIPPKFDRVVAQKNWLIKWGDVLTGV